MILINGVQSELSSEELKQLEEANKLADRQRAEWEKTELPKQKIAKLKALLSESDYKVIKNYEYGMKGLPLPYEPDALFNERQPLRDEINKLEEVLKNESFK